MNGSWGDLFMHPLRRKKDCCHCDEDCCSDKCDRECKHGDCENCEKFGTDECCKNKEKKFC